MTGASFHSAHNRSASVILTWNLSWFGNLTVVNRSQCNFCFASVSIVIVGFLNDSTNASFIAPAVGWNGFFIWAGPLNNQSNQSTHTVLFAQHPSAVKIYFNANLVQGHMYLIWTFLRIVVIADVPGMSSALGSAAAHVGLGGSRLSSVQVV